MCLVWQKYFSKLFSSRFRTRFTFYSFLLTIFYRCKFHFLILNLFCSSNDIYSTLKFCWIYATTTKAYFRKFLKTSICLFTIIFIIYYYLLILQIIYDESKKHLDPTIIQKNIVFYFILEVRVKCFTAPIRHSKTV